MSKLMAPRRRESATSPSRLPVRRRGGLRLVPWWLAVPGIAFAFAIHWVFPLMGGYYAFTDWDGLNAAKWIGLENFRTIFEDPVTSSAVTHTLQLAAGFVVLVNVVGLTLAINLNTALKSRNLLRSLFFLPVALSPIAIAFCWKYIFLYDGLLNQALGFVGLESWQRLWLADPDTAIWCVMFVLVWEFSGLTMVMYLAGLQSISPELYEAAAVDGAGWWRRFRKLTMPLLAPAFTIALPITSIFGLRLFDQILGLTGGGPGNATETLATQFYRQTFEFGKYGYGAALALVLAVLIAAITVVPMLILRARESRIT